MKKIVVFVLIFCLIAAPIRSGAELIALSADTKSEDIASKDNDLSVIEGASGCNVGTGGLAILAITGMLLAKRRREIGND